MTAQESGFSARSVLVVEDNVEVRKALVHALQQEFAGIDCSGIGTFWEAKSLLVGSGARDFDLVLLDIGLPDGSGVELIRIISERLPRTTPIVITIFDNDRTLFDALAAGAKGYLLKSATMASLIQQLRRIDGGEPPLSPQIAHRMMAHFKTSSRHSSGDGAAAEALTPREEDVLRMLGKGLTALDIAGALGMTRNTCATHIKSIYRKLRISSRAEAALEADRRGLL